MPVSLLEESDLSNLCRRAETELSFWALTSDSSGQSSGCFLVSLAFTSGNWDCSWVDLVRSVFAEVFCSEFPALCRFLRTWLGTISSSLESWSKLKSKLTLITFLPLMALSSTE